MRCAAGARRWPTGWAGRGHDLGFSVGIAQGYATLGRIGFEGRYDYAAIGSVTNLASRLCSAAEQDQILITQRVHKGAERYIVSDAVGELTLRGFTPPGHGLRHQGPGRCADDVVTSGTLTGHPLGPRREPALRRCSTDCSSACPQVWAAMRLNEEGESVVVVPSVTLDRVTEPAAARCSRRSRSDSCSCCCSCASPRLRMVYVTSMPVAPTIIEYYLALLPGIIPSHARARLSLVAVHDASPRPLSEKLLERPRLLRQIADLIPDRTRSHLVPYNTTSLERDVALALGIPMYGADPRLFDLGTKTGARRLFAEEGVRHPIGIEDLHTFDELLEATRSPPDTSGHRSAR